MWLSVQNVALSMVLLTTVLWGSWAQFIKKTDEWPIAAFMLWLYSFSLILITPAVLLLQETFIPEGIAESIAAHPGTVLLVFICGATFAIGIQIQMMVVKKGGLIFSTSITSMLTIPIGCFISSFFGGIPEDVSVFRLILGAVFLVSATLLCQKSTRMRDADNEITVEKGDRTSLKYMLILALCAIVFAPTYSLAMSIGTKTNLNEDGLPAVLLVGILCWGSFMGTLVVSGIRLTKNRQWGEMFAKRNAKYIRLACLSGLFHYGGNMIHTIASPIVSVAIAWPMGYLANVWQYIWGIVRGEFKGSKRLTYVTLTSGIVCFIMALVTLASALYW